MNITDSGGEFHYMRGVTTAEQFEGSKYHDKGTWWGNEGSIGNMDGYSKDPYVLQLKDDGSQLHVHMSGKEVLIPYKGDTTLKKEGNKDFDARTAGKTPEPTTINKDETIKDANPNSSKEDNNNIPPLSTSPIAVYNGILRFQYERKALKLTRLWRPGNPLAKSNEVGMQQRFKLKTEIRAKTIGGFKKFLDITEGPVKEQPVINKIGKVTRFWFTNPKYNVFSKVSLGLGVVGLGLTAYRIANAENPLRETAIVGGGFAAAWATMTIVGPSIAPLFAANPIIGGIVLMGIGAVAGFGGETVTKKILNFFNW